MYADASSLSDTQLRTVMPLLRRPDEQLPNTPLHPRQAAHNTIIAHTRSERGPTQLCHCRCRCDASNQEFVVVVAVVVAAAAAVVVVAVVVAVVDLH